MNGALNKEPDLSFDKILDKNRVFRSSLGKISGGKIDVKAGLDPNRLLFPLKGVNWFSLRGEELGWADYPPTFIEILNEIQLTELAIMRKAYAAKFSTLVDDQSKELAMKERFHLIGPYSFQESLKTLQSIPKLDRDPKTSVICSELMEFCGLALQAFHLYAPTGVPITDFYSTVSPGFTWTRAEGVTPRAKVLNLGNFQDPDWGKLARAMQISALLSQPIFTGFAPVDRFTDVYKAAPAARKTMVLTAPYLVINPTADVPGVTIFQLEKAVRAEQARLSTHWGRVCSLLEPPSFKKGSYGMPNSALSETAAQFTAKLARSKEFSLIAPNVRAYLQSFQAKVFMDLAVQRMEAILSGALEIDLSEENVGEFFAHVRMPGIQDSSDLDEEEGDTF